MLLICSVFASAQDSPLRIFAKPTPLFVKDALHAQGSVILRVEFLSTGRIRRVSVIRGLRGGISELAIEAAKRIEFEPETVGGTPVTKNRNIEYIYRYGSWERSSYRADSSTQSSQTGVDEKADAIVAKAVEALGGDRYLQVKTQIGRGQFSVIRDNAVVSFQTFTDVIVFPDKERTEFKSRGSRTVQVNTGDTGWIYDGDQELIKVQDDTQIGNFNRAIRTSLDNLLRGQWKGEAKLSYVGRRSATLGKRNDAVKLTYGDGFSVEFEFAEDGIPQRAIYFRKVPDGEDVKDEDRYAQFVDIDGVKAPFIIDRFANGAPTSRINFESIEFNKKIPESIFAKPSGSKDAKKSLKL